MNNSSDLQAQVRFQSFLQEATNHAPIPPVASKLQELPFTALSWKTFEQLCCRLVAELPNVEGEPYLYGTPGQDQKGIDVVARVRVNDRLERWCFQCKRIEHLTPSKLAKAIESLEYAANRYFFLVASSVGTELQDIIEPHNDKELWDCRIISKKLKDYPNLVAEFFGEWWLPIFSNSKTASRNPQQATRHFNSFNLPNPDPFFVGREDETDLLVSYLNTARSIVVEGLGGSGKTQLVIKILDGRNDRPTLWIDVESYLRVEDLQIALSSALQQIGIAASTTNLIQVLHSASIRVVFDGVEQATREDWDDMEDFFRLLLTRTRTPQFIFTSQVALSNLESDHPLPLKPLESEDAVKILQTRGIQGKELSFAEVNALNWLVNFAEGHILTLRLIAAHLQRLGDPSVIVKRIQQLGSFALDQPRRRKHTRSTSLNIALRLAYEFLTLEQKSLLLYLSYLPGGCRQIWLEYMMKDENILADITEIYDWYLVDRSQDDLNQFRYRVLNPIRSFVQAIGDTTVSNPAIHLQCEIAKQFMTHAMMLDEEYMQFGDVHWGLELFEMELSNYFAAVEYAYVAQERKNVTKGEEWEEATRTIWGLAWGLSTYLFVRGHLHRGITILRRGIEAGCQLGEECNHLYMMLLSMYGRVQDRAGIRAVASEFGVIVEKSSDLDLKAQYAIVRGELAFSEGKYDEADIYYQQAEQNYREALTIAATIKGASENSKSKRSITVSLAQTLAERARAREYMQDFSLGLDLGIQALELLRSTGEQINPPNVKFHIGRCYLGLGEYRHAFLCFTVAALQFHVMGTRQYLGNSLAEIGALAVQEKVQPSDLNCLTEEIICAGLNDVAGEIQSVLSTLPHVQLSWGMDALRKSFAVMALASYQLNPEFLLEWAVDLKQSLINPLVEDGLIPRDKISEAGVLVRELDFIVAAAYVSSQLRLSGNLIEPGLQNLCLYCYEMLAKGQDFRPFQWLATWINLHYPQQALITAKQLRKAALKTSVHGQPFKIE